MVFEGFDLDRMRYKRRFVRVHRDFPQGCGVFSRYRSNADDSLMQSKFKSRVDFPDIDEAFRIEDLDDLKNVSTEDESILESGGSAKDHQEEEGIGESEDKQNEMSSVKKRCLSFDNSTTMEVETNVVDTSKRVIVLGLAAKSKCPWRQPPTKEPRFKTGEEKVDTLKSRLYLSIRQ